MLLWQLTRGDSPLLVSVPHAGRHIPDAIALRMTARALDVPDTDWHVDELYAFVPSTGATLVVATHSRYVVDLNRDPSGAALYPGADNTELCPTRTFDNTP
ncbi:MAG: N-formylglutamate amidohydrolase, partial [Betaproteobacteria bacterium]